jgi:Saf4/Yju2 protein
MSAGLSLSAVQADGFYLPPDWDPQKESLDQVSMSLWLPDSSARTAHARLRRSPCCTARAHSEQCGAVDHQHRLRTDMILSAQHHGHHRFGDRARKLDQGILIIRFEMPFNVWCDGCGDLIGKGVRFNAEKKQAGTYMSSKRWAFTMRHHCGCRITVVTDPKNHDMVVESGAKRKACFFA